MIASLLLSLSISDFYNLAKVVQVEAKANTADEYCVAASVLNRVLSPKFPETVKDVVYSSGQYEGIYTQRLIMVKPQLLKRLSSPEGKANIIKWSGILNGRTDFKGQSMLKYRVASEDPMCHPKGNFYHYHWQ